LAKHLGLDRALYSRKQAWVQDCLAMIVGRLVYAGGKLALSNQWKNTALWDLCGTAGQVDVEQHCCAAPRYLVGTGRVQGQIISWALARGPRINVTQAGAKIMWVGHDFGLPPGGHPDQG
jgi:hypothetical protein